MDKHGQNNKEKEDISQFSSTFFMIYLQLRLTLSSTKFLGVVMGRITNSTKTILDQEFTSKDVFYALVSMKSTLILGLNGMPTIFFQNYWHVVISLSWCLIP